MIPYTGICYAKCPDGTAPVTVAGLISTCIACENPFMVKLCDPNSVDIALECIEPFLLTDDGKCIQNPNKEVVTVAASINDIGILPFPFLIAALFGCLIAVFGSRKKKKG